MCASCLNCLRLFVRVLVVIVLFIILDVRANRIRSLLKSSPSHGFFNVCIRNLLSLIEEFHPLCGHVRSGHSSVGLGGKSIRLVVIHFKIRLTSNYQGLLLDLTKFYHYSAQSFP